MTHLSFARFKTLGGLKTLEERTPDDIFLACASYERRSIAASRYLSRSYRAKKAIIYINEEFLEETNSTGKNLDRLKRVLAPRSERLVIARGSWRDPTKQLSSLRKELFFDRPDDGKQFNITVDITTFNREALIIAIALLRASFKKARLRLVYVSPKVMGPWLSKGFREIRNVIGFSGIQDPSQPTALIILSGFEPERTSKILEIHEPRKVFLGIGNPPTERKFLKRNIQEQQKSVVSKLDKFALSRQPTETFDFPANDVEGCFQILEKLVVALLGKYNVVIAPMNTKLSTVSAFLIAERHPEVQITYCLPGLYNVKKYSSGMSQIFVENLPEKTEQLLTPG